MTTKYAIANIKIPLEIYPNGDWNQYPDRITISIEEIENLPPPSTIQNSELVSMIQNIFQCSLESPIKISLQVEDDQPLPFLREPEPDPIYFVTTEEIQQGRRSKTPSKNMTFRRVPSNKNLRKTQSRMFSASTSHSI